MSETAITETALYLTFRLGDEMFSLDVSQAKEILDLSTITKVPRAPDFMRGVINVRGSGPDNRERYAQYCVGSESLLIFSTVELDHDAIDLLLIACIPPKQRAADISVDICNRLQHALAAVTPWIAIA